MCIATIKYKWYALQEDPHLSNDEVDIFTLPPMMNTSCNCYCKYLGREGRPLFLVYNIVYM